MKVELSEWLEAEICAAINSECDSHQDAGWRRHASTFRALGPETGPFRGPSPCELHRLSDNRCESSWPPPLSRVAQPVSKRIRPVGHHQRALLVSYTYIGICAGWRESGRRNHGTTLLVKTAQKSRTGPEVSNPRDAPLVSPAMQML